MPKTKNSRKSTASKNKLLSKTYKLSSPKGLAFLFVMAFALIGAILIVRSFAATAHRVVFRHAGYMYTMNADGTDKKRLDNQNVAQYYADSSPSGARVVYAKGSALYVANIDGTGIRKLTSPAAGQKEVNARWSSDGNQIAYSRQLAASSPNQFQIRVINSDGTNDHWVTSFPSSTPLIDWVYGTKQLLIGNRQQQNIFTVNSDGTGGKVIVSNISFRTVESLGSTKKIAYSGYDPQTRQEGVFTANLDGSNKKYIGSGDLPSITMAAYVAAPHAWYGSKVMYINSLLKGNTVIKTSNTDGSAQKIVTTVPKQVDTAMWSSDGNGILFATWDGFNISSFKYVNADGTGYKTISNSSVPSNSLADELYAW